MTSKQLDFSAIRERLANAQGKQFWRSLEELADSEEFVDFLHHEFPRLAPQKGRPLKRRDFMRLMGASLALGGLSGCTNWNEPHGDIVPYVKPPEALVPGKPLYFASAMPLAGTAVGLLIETREGRPIKVEGNPDHPASLGASDVFSQASILSLYDPDRSTAVLAQGQPSDWGGFLDALRGALDAERGGGGAGLRILSGATSSPTLAAQMSALLGAFPSARWHIYEPAADGEGAMQAAFGAHANVFYRLDQANTILSLDSDFLAHGPGSLRYARDFAAKRKPDRGQTTMNRLYVVEAGFTPTGASADHRLALRPSQIEGFARALARELGVDVGGDAPAPEGTPPEWVTAVARDLQGQKGASAVIPGDQQPAVVHALAHAMNQALGNMGKTVMVTDPVVAAPEGGAGTLQQLVDDMRAGTVKLLVILDGNPAYTAPADLNFGDALGNVPFSAHLGLYRDETATRSTWHIPAAHYMESWSDARAYDGTITIIQPMIAPFYNGKSAHEMIAALQGQVDKTDHDLVMDHWKGQQQGNFEAFWDGTLQKGVVADSALPAANRTPQTGAALASQATPMGGDAIEIAFRPDPYIYDGQFTNNGWLQELPRPLTKITWDNAAIMAPALAERLGVSTHDQVDLRANGQVVRAPVFVLPGHPDRTITVHLGYGRQQAGRVGNGAGFNANLLRTAAAPWMSTVEVGKAGGRHHLSVTQNHFTLEGREIIHATTLDEFNRTSGAAPGGGEAGTPEGEHNTLYPEWEYNGYKWGMAVDMNACVGCNACVVACVAENNIPVVGKDQVARGREMHWLRIDTYFEGGLDNPDTYFQPMLCQHCEKAPCEPVCPVGATTHSTEGLSQMVYNRCVGTRYCSNNCPYKVRRFNFLQYSDEVTESLKLRANPEVTVRNRGVMEKCSFCIQRIARARQDAESEGRTIREGDFTTACAQACPSQAIVFGNLNDPNSQVSKLWNNARGYQVLAEIGTQPRIEYLGAVKNPNPELKA